MDNWSSGFYPYPPYYYNPSVSVPAPYTYESHTSDEGSDLDEATYTYYVKIINPKRKSDFIVRMWHSAKHAFKSPTELKVGLMESFPGEVPSTTSFQVGYLESPGSTKRWLVEDRDLIALYNSHEPGSKINLWCDAKIAEENSNHEREQPNKKKENSTRYTRRRN